MKRYILEVKVKSNENTIFFYDKTESECVNIIDDLKGVEWFDVKEIPEGLSV